MTVRALPLLPVTLLVALVLGACHDDDRDWSDEPPPPPHRTVVIDDGPVVYDQEPGVTVFVSGGFYYYYDGYNYCYWDGYRYRPYVAGRANYYYGPRGRVEVLAPPRPGPWLRESPRRGVIEGPERVAPRPGVGERPLREGPVREGPMREGPRPPPRPFVRGGAHPGPGPRDR